MSDDDLLPLSDEPDSSGFDVVLRGYDRRQVDDYVDRVELVIADHDIRHAESAERLTHLEEQLAALHGRLEEAERVAAGLPEPASLIGERLATMLRLAEQEAEELVTQARDRAAASTSERTAELDRREAEIQGAAAAADQLRLEAQRDAEALRQRSHSDAESLGSEARRTADDLVAQARQQAEQLVSSAHEQAEHKKQVAEEDVAILHEDARAHAAELVFDAQRRVDELAAQRDAIAGQLQNLRETLSAAVQPLHPQPPGA